MPRSDRAAYLMLTGMALSFGGTWVAADLAVAAVPPFAIAAIRFGLASVLLFAWTRLAGRRLAPIRRADLPMIAGLGLTAVAGYNWLFLTGLTLAPASDGAIITPSDMRTYFFRSLLQRIYPTKFFRLPEVRTGKE